MKNNIKIFAISLIFLGMFTLGLGSVSKINSFTNLSLINNEKDLESSNIISGDDFLNDLLNYDFVSNNYIYTLNQDVDFSTYDYETNNNLDNNLIANSSNPYTIEGNGHTIYGYNPILPSINSDADLEKYYLLNDVEYVNFEDLIFENTSFLIFNGTNLNFKNIYWNNTTINPIVLTDTFTLESDTDLNVGLFIKSLNNGSFDNVVFQNISLDYVWFDNNNSTQATNKDVVIAPIAFASGDVSFENLTLDTISISRTFLESYNYTFLTNLYYSALIGKSDNVSSLSFNNLYIHNIQIEKNATLIASENLHYSILSQNIPSTATIDISNIMIDYIFSNKSVNQNLYLPLIVYNSSTSITSNDIYFYNENPNFSLSLPDSESSTGSDASENINLASEYDYKSISLQEQILGEVNYLYLSDGLLPQTIVDEIKLKYNFKITSSSLYKENIEVQYNLISLFSDLYIKKGFTVSLVSNNKIVSQKSIEQNGIIDGKYSKKNGVDLYIYNSNNDKIFSTNLIDKNIIPLIVTIFIVIIIVLLLIVLFALYLFTKKRKEAKSIALVEEVVKETQMQIYGSENYQPQFENNYNSSVKLDDDYYSEDQEYNDSYENYDDYQYEDNNNFDKNYDDYSNENNYDGSDEEYF